MTEHFEDQFISMEIPQLFDQPWWFHIGVNENKDFILNEFGYEFDMSASEIRTNPDTPFHGPAKYPVKWFKEEQMVHIFPRHIIRWVWLQLEKKVDEQDYDFNQSYIDSTCDDRKGK